MKLLRTRPRRRAVALVALGGSLIGVGGAVMPAKAECLAVSAWVYRSQQGRDYEMGPEWCVTDTPWNNELVGFTHLDDTQPPGTITGAGVGVWVPIP